MEKIIIPVIETSRLILRAHRITDFESSYAMWANPAIVHYIGGKASTEQQAWARLLNYLGLWSLLGYGYWAVEKKTTSEFVGEIGLADFKREITPSLKGIPEMGWVIASKFQGQGYASEALSACLDWADSHLTTRQISCIIHRQNSASLRISEKLGFEKVQDSTYAGAAVTMFLKNLSSTFPEYF